MQIKSYLKAGVVASLAACLSLVAVPMVFAQSQALGPGKGGKVHLLPATLETTQWGWFDNAQAPVLKVESGDTVVLETMMHSHDKVVPGRTIEEIKKLRTDHPGRGPHTITGPIYVNGAEPGDVLKVKLNKIVPRAYGTNFNVPGMFGQFPKDYPDGQVKYLYLDLDRKLIEFLPGVFIPLQPFPGTIGVFARRYRAVAPGLLARHAEGAGERRERDEHAGQELDELAVQVEVKVLHLAVRVVLGELAEHARYVEVGAVGARHDAVDLDFEHIAGLGAVDEDRPGDGVRAAPGVVGA